MADHTDTSIETYLDRVDARLAELDDNGERVTFINLCIAVAEEKRRRFEQTLDTSYGDAFQISGILAGLEARKERVTASIRASIAEAEAALEQPYIADFVAAALARRHGFELPSQATRERGH